MAAHSNHGFSGQSRIIACPGSVRMQDGLPNTTNPAAELGTAVHEATEFALNLRVSCNDLIGMTFNDHVLTDDMAFAGQVYVDYVMEILKLYPDAIVYIEGKVCLSTIDPKLLWGTSDIIIYVPSMRLLIVGDYKNGYGVVEVYGDQYVYSRGHIEKGNAQCIGYGLAALDTHNLWDGVDHVVTFIAQPNIDHIDGPVRLHTYSMTEIYNWLHIYAESHELALLPDAPTFAGSHCKYCRAKGHCKTRIMHMLESMQMDKAVSHCSPEELLTVYNEIDTFIYSLEAVKDRMVALARQGMHIPGRKLVKGIVRAKCVDEHKLVAEAVASGIDKTAMFNTKIKGKTDLVKVVGQKMANKYFVTPEAGLTLVNMSDKRPAVMADSKPNAKGIFGAVNK